MNFKVSITRMQQSNNSISIMIEDVASSIEFLRMEMTPENFTKAITGIASQNAVGTTYNLEYVGKQRITEKRSVVCPISSYDRTIFEQWLLDNCQEEGWIISTYLGSQSSIIRNNNTTTLNYTVTKFI